MDWQAVFFDFDGVILDSVDVKTQAFGKLFRVYGAEIEKAVVRYHLENGGVSRYDKFRYYYENLLSRKISKEEIDDLSKEFSDLVVKGVIASPFIKGAYETLNMLKENAVPAYVVSGTPHDEINFIVKEKGLADFFEEVHGSPRKKWEIAAEILKRRNFRPADCIFIGDAKSDLKAAKKTGMRFLGIVQKLDDNIFPNDTIVSQQVRIPYDKEIFSK